MTQSAEEQLQLEIEIEVSEDVSLSTDFEALNKAVKAYLNSWTPFEGFQGVIVQVDLHFVGDEEIQSLNLQHREKDKVTDVLSFPVHENLREEASELPELKYLGLGDVFICVPQAGRQASEHQVDLDSEIYHLAVHGILHLLGYDHEINEKEERLMQVEEKAMISMIADLKKS